MRWTQFKSFNPEERKDFIRVLDLRQLAKVAFEDTDTGVRKMATAAIVAITNDPVTKLARQAAIMKITDQKILESLALNDADPEIRMVAAEGIKDQVLLRKIALEDPDPRVRERAASRIDNQDILKEIALDTDRSIEPVTVKDDLTDDAKEALKFIEENKTKEDAEEELEELEEDDIDELEDEGFEDEPLLKSNRQKGGHMTPKFIDIILNLLEKDEMALAHAVLGLAKDAEKDEKPEEPKDPLKDDLLKFFMKNPNPTDKQVHDFAESKGVEPDKAEEVVYQLATNYAQFVLGGRSNEKKFTKNNVDAAQLTRGIEVEKEHTENEVDAEKIAMDHLAEFPNYYTALDKMESELNLTEKK